MKPEKRKPTLLLISQVFVPDPAAVGQYMAQVAEAVDGRDWYVKVYAANRGYDDPRQVYPRYEHHRGMHIRRLPWSSFGKRSIALRLVGQLSFVMQTFLRGIFSRRLDAILVTTSPPMGGVVAWAITLFRRVPIHFWVMDMNPDQAVRLGAFGAGHPLVRVFDFFLLQILKRSSTIVALDRFMQRRLAAKMLGINTVRDGWEGRLEGHPGEAEAMARIAVIPPWPMEDLLTPVAAEENPFHREQVGEGRIALMYSGNHSIAHPIETFLLAAARIGDDDRLRFLFVGGGKRKGEVDRMAAETQTATLRSLPYQPLEALRFSLSAGDVHLVSMGEDMVGCVHPCKFYSALALGRPIILLGPLESHVGDVLREADIGWQVEHGDVEGMVRVYEEILDGGPELLRMKGEVARAVLAERFGEEELLERFVEKIVGPPGTS